MTYLRSLHRVPFPLSFSNPVDQKKKTIAGIVALLFATLPGFTQDQPQSAEPPDSAQEQTEVQNATVTLPAGTHLALVLTQPVQTRYIHRGDDIYAQVISPVGAGNEVVIPPGTFVQGTVDKLQRSGGRGVLRLLSMSITFPDGYVTPISGPIVLQTTDGYAMKDPGPKRAAGAIILPFAAIGVGALIGHSVGTAHDTLTASIPDGCVGPPPGCVSSSMTIPGSKAKDAAIGASIGGAAGAIASIVLLVGSRHFYLDAGSPVEMTLQEPVTLPQDEVAKAVRQSQEYRPMVQEVAPRPQPPLPSDMPVNHGTCYTPGTHGTPDTVIPGVPGPDGIPGPPTVIPGIPPTPGTPYPCP